ncbi:MAG: hypothetical protein JWQ50_4075 [Caballeronia mineralivorans]|jgi:hypothetical protein|nr:hypothetical protein [Caballeronia mineralivorans]
MQISVQVVVQTEGDKPASVTEIAHIERVGFDAGSLGLHLDEAKSLLGRLQRSMIDAQATEAIARLSVCPKCDSQLARKGHHRLAYRSVFGRLSIDSPRFYRCRCSGRGRQSVSPLANCLHERTSPELQYLQAKFAALMSYGLTVQVLEEIFYRSGMCWRPPDPAPRRHFEPSPRNHERRSDRRSATGMHRSACWPMRHPSMQFSAHRRP